MKTTLIFVRHGESSANGKGVFAGHLDLPLSERGRQQAEETARYIKENYPVDAIYSSDLQRAFETAIPVGRQFHLEIARMPQLREIFAGDWQGRSFDELQTSYADTYGVWLRDIGLAHPLNGESVEELSDRIWNCVQEICRREQGKTVVIVTHATPIRALQCRLLGKSLGEMKNVSWVSNASVTEVSVENGKWNLQNIGADAHLSNLKTQFPANV